MENFRYLEGVTTLQLDVEACVGCGVCEIVCPHAVFQMNGKKAEIGDLDGCMECGACAQNCAAGAIRVTPVTRRWLLASGRHGGRPYSIIRTDHQALRTQVLSSIEYQYFLDDGSSDII